VIIQHPRECALELEAQPHRIGQVRRIVSATLRYWTLEPLVDTALLGLTELLANVHRHAQPDKRCTVELLHAKDRLTVSVTDNDPRPPRIGSRTESLATTGRGLAMVAALSDSWGTRPTADDSGKVVWFTLREPAPTPVAVSSPPLITLTHRASRQVKYSVRPAAVSLA
jgi:hypothetical protein